MKGSYKKKLSKIKKRKDRFIGKDLITSIFHISLSQNNVHVTVSDYNGEVLCWSSSGCIGLKNNKKSTPFAAKNVGRNIAEKASKIGVRNADICIKGFSSTLDEVVRGISSIIKINSLRDVTPIAFNGTRPRGPRRV